MALALVLVLVGSPTDRFDVGWFSCHRLADYLAGWLSVWVSGCLGVWVSGCLGVWVSGCLGVWVSGCLGVLVSGCLGVWVSGCLGVWVSACLSSCCQVSKVSELKKNVYRTAASRESKLIDFVGGIER